MRRSIMLIVLFIVLSVILVGCGRNSQDEKVDQILNILTSQMNEVEKERDDAIRERNSLQAQINNNNSTSTTNLLSIIFYPKDGKTYTVDDSSIFYSECYLTTPMQKELQFTCPQSYNFTLQNGQRVFLSLTSDGQMVWSSKKPYFREIK